MNGVASEQSAAAGRLPLVPLVPRREVHARDRQALAERRFEVRGHAVELEPPVDWRMDPVDHRSWRFWLHTMQFLDIPLRVHETDGDVGALRVARDLALDWVRANPIGGERTGDFAWTDMSAGIRAAILGCTWRDCRRRGLLAGDDDELLARSLREHAAWLSEDANHTAETNHGLYQDAGLFLLGRYAEELPEAAEWRARAQRRFLATLARHVDFDEGMHREHSPGYHMYVRELVHRLHARAGIGGRRLAALLARLDAAAAWLVLPDGAQLPFGDTDMAPAPAFATAGPRPEGLGAFPRTGYAVVCRGASYLAMTCCHHSRAHKHADELSWCLHERGRLIVGDAGRYGYRDERDPARVYARSSHGHSTLIVDGESFPWQSATPYGSGLLATGEGHGWYAILGENPLLDDVAHRRLLLYRPGELVVVLDRVESGREREIERRVHLGPGLVASRRSGGIVARAGDVDVATVVDASAAPVEASVSCGVRQPRMDGWTFPRDLVEVPSPAVALRTRVATALLVHAVAVAPTRAPTLSADDGSQGWTVDVGGPAASARLTVTRSGGRLDVAEDAL